MDADKLLAQIRHTIVTMRRPAAAPDRVALMAQVVAQFEALDAHLSGGGRPPEAWAEGPDAPYLDEPYQCPERHLLRTPEGTQEFYCTLDKGHEGDHVSEQTVAADRWPNHLDPLGGPIPGHNGSHLPGDG